MSEDRGKLTSVAWGELFPWINLAVALRLSLNFRGLLLAALAVLGTVAGWRIIGSVAERVRLPAASSDAGAALSIAEIRLEAAIEAQSQWPWHDQAGVLLPLPAIDQLATPESIWSTNPLRSVFHWLSRPFVGLFDARSSLSEFIFWLASALWELFVWSLFGTALTRSAAVALAREEQVPLGQLLAFARAKWLSCFAAVLFPMVGVLLAAVPMALFGLLLHVGVGVFLAGLLWILPLLGGLFMSVLLVGLYFGWPLMWATVSSEGTDSFDALSRSYAYTYQRPLHYFFYALVASLLGILGWAVVSIFAAAVVELSMWGTSWLGRVLDAADGGWLSRTGLQMLAFWLEVVATLKVAYLFSYFWTAATAIYFLLRRQVDATEMDEVYMPEADESYGLPALATDSAGVVGLADAAGNAPPAGGPVPLG